MIKSITIELDSDEQSALVQATHFLSNSLNAIKIGVDARNSPFFMRIQKKLLAENVAQSPGPSLKEQLESRIKRLESALEHIGKHPLWQVEEVVKEALKPGGAPWIGR